MRFVLYVGSLLLSLSAMSFAAETQTVRHTHPHAQPSAAQVGSSESGSTKIGYYNCDIAIMNDAYTNVTVYGRYDDGVPMIPFNIYSGEYTHFIDLYYNGYCHSGMYLSIVAFSGYTVFSGYVFSGETLHIVPYAQGKNPKVNVEKAKEVKKV